MRTGVEHGQAARRRGLLVGRRHVPADPWCFFFSSRRRHTRCGRDWSSDVCSSDLRLVPEEARGRAFGFFYASTGLAALPSSLLFGLWWKLLGPQTAFLIGAALAGLALASLLLWRSRFR